MISLADIAVLFVDDEVEILCALKSCFRREPYVKLFAESAEQALLLLEESNCKVNLLYFHGQGKKSYLQSKGDVKNDRERQRGSQKVQQRVQG
jgi:CheY-like chemotaxis protein